MERTNERLLFLLFVLPSICLLPNCCYLPACLPTGSGGPLWGVSPAQLPRRQLRAPLIPSRYVYTTMPSVITVNVLNDGRRTRSGSRIFHATMTETVIRISPRGRGVCVCDPPSLLHWAAAGILAGKPTPTELLLKGIQ